MKTIDAIRKEETEKHTKLFNECGLFWAFSNEQFATNKTPLQEGEKYVSIGAGGYMPKHNVDKFCKGMAEIKKWTKEQTKANKLQEKEIAYELANHECYYTGDIDTVVGLFDGTYSREQIRNVYNKERAKHIND